MPKKNRIEPDGEWVLDRDQQPKFIRRDEMDDPIDPQEFWKDPNAFRGRGLDSYIDLCVPSEYFGYAHFSIRLVRAITAHIGFGARILELGCSVGRNLHYLREAGYENLTGVEINPESCALAREWFKTSGDDEWVQIINSPIEEYISGIILPKFDVIFTQGVLMHLPLASNWVFAAIASHADKLIVTHEVEETGGIGEEFKWARNYKEVFAAYGFEQIEETIYSPQILRVMRKK